MLQDIHPICVLGQGAFGKVILARYLGKLYALKMLWKSHVINMGVQEHVKREAKILMSCRNDFLVNLHATGKSEDKLYMLMEPVLGGELFTHVRVGGCGCFCRSSDSRTTTHEDPMGSMDEPHAGLYLCHL